MGSTTIEDLPDPVIEYILSYLSPYKDLKQCMQVSKTWKKHVHDVVRKIKRDFNNAIATMTVQWHHLLAEPGPTISKRYSHSACCSGNNMYIFGGCTTANTTFNDLWRFDLGSRCWIRPLATGTYPPPKACATLVSHEDNLILFGGWTHNSPYPLHQVWRIFNHLHMYNTSTNRWTQVVTPLNSPAMAGHSATIQGDYMVVFGGIQKHPEGNSARHSVFFSANDVWLLNLKTLNWKKQATSEVQPISRYGHSQVSVDDKHILIIGGCGGPNMLFNDIWMLTISDNPEEPWTWQEMKVECRENAAPHLAFHPACKIGNQVVVMSKTQKSRASSSSLPYPLRAPSRIWVPPRAENEAGEMRGTPRQPADIETCVNGKKGVLKRHYERRQAASAGPTSSSDEDECQSRDTAKKLAGASPSNSKNTSPNHDTSQGANIPDAKLSDPSTSGVNGDAAPQANLSASPSSDEPKPNLPQDSNQGPASPSRDSTDQQTRPVAVRPNARRNRQRQLEGLDRMEQRLRDLRACSQRFPPTMVRTIRFPLSFVQNKTSCPHPTSSRNPMCVYVLDISRAVSHGCVTWRVLKNQCATAPEEIILYSLVLGRGEMVMFGGIQKDLNSRQQEGEAVPEIVSNSLHFMSAQRFII